MSYDHETQAIFDELWALRLARVDEQLEHIANTAYWLGRQLARHSITSDDVDRRLEALCSTRDPEIPEHFIALVPYDIARTTALAALRRGMGVTQ